MNYYIQLTKDIYVTVNIRKQTFGKHPIVTAYLNYRGSTLRSYPETTQYGLLYDEYKEESAINVAMVLLGETFQSYEFVFEDLPNTIEYNSYKHCNILPYPTTKLPVGSIFEIEDILIDRRAEIYYVLNNSNEGKVIASYTLLKLFPQIKNKYTRSLFEKETVLGYLSNKIIGKKFKVIAFGKYYEEHTLEEILM